MACDSQCCRICAQRNRTLISIFGEEGIFRQLITKLKYCLQIIVFENDGLPSTICWKCLSKLEICFDLMQDSIRGQIEFKKQNFKHSMPEETRGKTQVKMEENNIEFKSIAMEENSETENQPSETQQYSISSTTCHTLHNTPCHSKECLDKYSNVQVKMEEDSAERIKETEMEPVLQTAGHSSTSSSAVPPCYCEQCVSQYGSLPLLAEVIDRTDEVNKSGPSHDQHSNIIPETIVANQQEVSEASGPIRVSKKSISCEFCGKLFGHTGDLNKHRRKHTGERPYPCSQCNKRFSHASNLLRHQKIHSGEMPHECPVCTKRFSRKDKMMNHLKNSHKYTPETQTS